MKFKILACKSTQKNLFFFAKLPKLPNKYVFLTSVLFLTNTFEKIE